MSTSMFRKISLIATDSKGEPQTLSKTGVVLAAVCLAVLPLEISQLVFALIGAVGYAVVTQWQQQKQQSGAKKNRLVNSESFAMPKQKKHGRDEVSSRDKVRVHLSGRDTASQGHKDVRQEGINSKPLLQPSIAPISAPVFKATGWDAEVDELLAQIAPTTVSNKAVQQLARYVQQTIRPLMPEIEVVGFASSNFSRGTAFGVAVPEVDLVATVSPDALVQRFLRRNGQFVALASVDMRKLQKTAIRACTDRLVASAGFKFRRSAFRGHEPKVTLLAPMALGSSEVAIPVDFAVNSTTPLSSAALLAECGRIEPRAKSLILLVKRWAKDRGICHVAKGHFSPYGWSLLAAYFLQAGVFSDGSLLPPMGKVVLSGTGSKPAPEEKLSSAGKSVGRLFQEFIHFYATDFDWHNEAVSVRSGKRAPPDLSLPLHIVLDDAAGTSEAGPSVEDPFEIRHNLGDSMNSSSLARLHEELARAQRLCSQNASLTELLQPWEPEREVDDGIKEVEEEKDDEGVTKSIIKTASQGSQSQTVLSRSAAPRPHGGDAQAPSCSAPAQAPPWRSARVAATAAANAETIRPHRQQA